jgi:hypothetical protein
VIIKSYPVTHSSEIKISPGVNSEESDLAPRRKQSYPKKYFNHMIGQEQYIRQNHHDIENLSILLQGRERESILLVSNKPNRVNAALQKGYGVVPIVHSSNFELILAESYLLIHRH